MNTITRAVLSLFLMNISCSAQAMAPVPGLIGQLPNKVVWLVQQLNRTLMPGQALPYKNRLIFHGPPGNGKSKVARLIADLSDREFLQLDGPSVVDKYQGSGAENIRLIFEKALNIIETTDRKVVILAEEIDAIAANNDQEFRTNHAAAIQQLWIELDKHKNNHDIFFVCTTNHFTKLSKVFLDRFGNNVVEIGNPDAQLRQEVLQYYFDNQRIPLTASLLKSMVKKSDGLSIRCLEDLAGDVRMAADIASGGVVSDDLVLRCLAETRKKFDDNKSEEKDTIDPKLQKLSLMVGIVGGSLGCVVSAHALYDVVYKYFYPPTPEQILANLMQSAQAAY